MQVSNNNVNYKLLLSSFFSHYHFSDDLLSDLKRNMKQEKIRMKLIKNTDNEFEFCSQDKSIKILFLINSTAHIIKYDIYFKRYDSHIDANTLFNFKKLTILLDTFGLLTYPEPLPDIMFILDEAIHWAQKNKFSIIKNNLT